MSIRIRFPLLSNLRFLISFFPYDPGSEIKRINSSISHRESHCVDPPCARAYRYEIISDWKNNDSSIKEDDKKVSSFPVSFSLFSSHNSTCRDRHTPSSCIYSASSPIVIWISGLSDSNTGTISRRIRLRSYATSSFVLSFRYSTLFSRAYSSIHFFVVEMSGRSKYPVCKSIPDNHRIFAHFIILPITVSVWSPAWCAVRIYLAPYCFLTVSKYRYRSRLAIASIFIFSSFAIDLISIFLYSNRILWLLHIFATNSLSQSDSSHRSIWSKCTTIIFSIGCLCRIRSRRTILSTHPLTASIRISSIWICSCAIEKNECIRYFCKEFRLLTNPRKSSSGATLLSISLWHLVHWCRIISHLFFR